METKKRVPTQLLRIFLRHVLSSNASFRGCDEDFDRARADIEKGFSFPEMSVLLASCENWREEKPAFFESLAALKRSAQGCNVRELGGTQQQTIQKAIDSLQKLRYIAYSTKDGDVVLRIKPLEITNSPDGTISVKINPHLVRPQSKSARFLPAAIPQYFRSYGLRNVTTVQFRGYLQLFVAINSSNKRTSEKMLGEEISANKSLLHAAAGIEHHRKNGNGARVVRSLESFFGALKNAGILKNWRDDEKKYYFIFSPEHFAGETKYSSGPTPETAEAPESRSLLDPGPEIPETQAAPQTASVDATSEEQGRQLPLVAAVKPVRSETNAATPEASGPKTSVVIISEGKTKAVFDIVADIEEIHKYLFENFGIETSGRGPPKIETA